MATRFDPDAAARPGSGVFGLTMSRAESRVVIVGAPFDATTSYGGGAARGPEAVRTASAQVDLHDHQFGNVYEQGIFMEENDDGMAAMSREARESATPIIEAGGIDAVRETGNAQERSAAETALKRVDAACERVNAAVFERCARAHDEGKFPILLGGDHSTPFGSIRAAAERVKRTSERAGLGRGSLGILHVDAHMDLREAFEGFAWSHASIMRNVLERIGEVSRLVQVGVRDYSGGEAAFAREQGERVRVFFDHDLACELDDGGTWSGVCRRIVEGLPQHVYVSFDIDGLDPSLCPHTGTPVAGGLSFSRACALIAAVRASGRTVVGADLVEVCPGPGAGETEPEWDANVGARVLYKLCALGR